MSQSLKLGPTATGLARIRRVNRMPIVAAFLLSVSVFAMVIYGISLRGMRSGDEAGVTIGGLPPASTYADQLTRGVPDGIIGEPTPLPVQPTPIVPSEASPNPFMPSLRPAPQQNPDAEQVNDETLWKTGLKREQEEQYLRELHRQRMARVQANDSAYDSPIAVDLHGLEGSGALFSSSADEEATPDLPSLPAVRDLYSAAMEASLGGLNVDPNGQTGKDRFFNQDIRNPGYLPNTPIGQLSSYELKRGSVIPATLVTGINSDLPGRITAQVSQNVYDSATGRHLLVPQGSKLLGRYDSKVSFGQNRVLVIWTDLILPDGSTLQIGGMAGTDAAGYGGFRDRVDNHYLRTFGAALLTAFIGAGTEMALPHDRAPTGTNSTPEAAARRSFAETFARTADRILTRNLDVQPTIEIRPGYHFNVLVDQDIVFPSPAR